MIMHLRAFVEWVGDVNRGCSDPGISFLEISDSVSTGDRGLVARQQILQDTCIMSLKGGDPRLVLTPPRAVNLLHCCSCFSSMNGGPIIVEPQDALVLFFFHLRHAIKTCDLVPIWRKYYDFLPKSFTDVAYVSVLEHSTFTKVVSHVPMEVRIEFVSRLNRLQSSFKQITGSSEVANSDFAWAWSLVNSRCVYLDISKLSSEPFNTPHIHSKRTKWLRLRSGADLNIAVVPFFDLFNHSPAASANMCVVDGELRLTSESGYSTGEQVFINYGKHSNLFLLCEYGFSIPGDINNCDVIRPTYNNLISISPCKKTLHNVLEGLHLEGTEDVLWDSVYLAPISGPSYYLLLILHAIFSNASLTIAELYCLDETVRSPGVLVGLRILMELLVRECEDALASTRVGSAFVDQLVLMVSTRMGLLKSLMKGLK